MDRPKITVISLPCVAKRDEAAEGMTVKLSNGSSLVGGGDAALVFRLADREDFDSFEVGKRYTILVQPSA